MSRANFIFFVIFITFILPGPIVTPIASDAQYEKLALFKGHLYDSYNQLANGKWSESYRNLTGFMLSYGDALDGKINQTYPLPGKDYDHWLDNQNYSILPDEVTRKAKSIWALEQDESHDQMNYYTNISSTLKGQFELKNTSFVKLPLALPQYLVNFNEDVGIPSSETTVRLNTVGNITQPGNIKVDITPIDMLHGTYYNEWDTKIKLVSIDFEVSDIDETEKHNLETKGFYFVETGNIVTSTNSAKFFALYGGIQHLTFNDKNYELAQKLALSYFNNTLFQTMSERDNNEISFNYLTQVLDNAQSHCEYVSYFHLNKVPLSRDEIKDIDKELQSPIGRPIDYDLIPKLNMTGLLYSPECAIQLNIPTVYGVKSQIQVYRYHKIVMIGIGLLLTQIVLIMKQMNYSNTPSTISRISFWSICLMSLVDGALAMLFLVSSAIWTKLYLSLTVSAFLAFVLATIFEMRFMISIYTSQLNERSVDLFTAMRGRPLDERDENNDSSNNAPAEPLDEAQVGGTIYSRYFFVLIIFTFITLNSIMWSKPVRKAFEYIALFVLNSYWLPQAYRNVIKGSHRSFKGWFIALTTIVRTIPLGYVFVVRENAFDHHYDLRFFLVLVGWLGLQIMLLIVQGIFGARFFLPKKWLPQTYDYHPILTEGDLESGFGIQHEHTPLNTDNENNAQQIKTHEGHCTVDCAICMNEVELPVLKSNLDHPSLFLLRRKYMVTPCRHIFHSGCLEAWMKYKLQCPVCRTGLPPI